MARKCFVNLLFFQSVFGIDVDHSWIIPKIHKIKWLRQHATAPQNAPKGCPKWGPRAPKRSLILHVQMTSGYVQLTSSHVQLTPSPLGIRKGTFQGFLVILKIINMGCAAGVTLPTRPPYPKSKRNLAR